MNTSIGNEKLAQIFNKCWADDDFKKQLIASPTDTLKSEGIELANNPQITFLENTGNEIYILIPPKPHNSTSNNHINQIANASTSGKNIGTGRVSGDDWCECCGVDLGIM